MSDPTLALEGHELPSPEPTPGAGQGKVSHKVRPRFARGSDSGPGFTDEMSCLLRTRLRLAILIILAGFSLHLVRNLLLRGLALDHHSLRFVVVGCEMLVLAIV